MSAPILTRRRQRLKIDLLDFGPPRDVFTRQPFRAWHSSSLRIDLGFFYGAALADIASSPTLASVRIEIKAQSGDDSAPAPAPDAAALLAKTISSFDTTTTEATWNGDTKQHATVNITDSEMAFAFPNGGKAWLSVIGTFTGDTEPTTFASGPIEILQDGYSDPGSSVTPTVPSFVYGYQLTSYTGGGATALDGLASGSYANGAIVATAIGDPAQLKFWMAAARDGESESVNDGVVIFDDDSTRIWKQVL